MQSDAEEAPLLTDGSAGITSKTPTSDTEEVPKAKGSRRSELLITSAVICLLIFPLVLFRSLSGSHHKVAVKNLNAGNAKCISPPQDAKEACDALEDFLGLWDTYDPLVMQKGINEYTTPEFSLHLGLDNSGYIDIYRPNVGLRMQAFMLDKDMLGFDFGPNLMVGSGSGPKSSAALTWRQRIEESVRKKRQVIEEGIQEEKQAIKDGLQEKKDEIEEALAKERDKLSKLEAEQREAVAQIESELGFSTTEIPSTSAPAMDTEDSASSSSEAGTAPSKSVTITRAGKISLKGLSWLDKTKMGYIMKDAYYSESQASGLHNCESCDAEEIFKLSPKNGKWLISGFTILKMV